MYNILVKLKKFIEDKVKWEPYKRRARNQVLKKNVQQAPHALLFAPISNGDLRSFVNHI